jgi:ElaB/YqjD/DUF883 family membrane-anchored ribosome-binding protein
MNDPVRDWEAEAGTRSGELMELAFRSAGVARQRIAEGSERVKEFIIREPARAVGLALGVGVLIGWLIKRR